MTNKKSEFNSNQIKSRKRISDHGEVFTAEREVKDMIDLVKQESTRIDSRFLEPACGSGNFLIEVLDRRLEVLKNKFKNSQIEYERNSLVAVASLYGIDILEDNIQECRTRIFDKINNAYTKLFSEKCNNIFRENLEFVIRKNLIHGDALTLMSVEKPNEPLIFSEWSAVNGVMIKRRDFTLAELLNFAPTNRNEHSLFSDLDEEVFIPTPIKVYPLTHYLRLKENE